MKNLPRSLLLALALAMGTWVSVQAKTFEQSFAAYERKDYRTAFTGFKKLADQGNAGAQYNLGYMYSNGQGVPKNEQQAALWLRKAAEQGYADAQLNLGARYLLGIGVPKDTQQAVVWYRQAAEQGLALAQYNLGMMYRDGLGVPKDDQSAYFWWLLASAQGAQSAVEGRDLVERYLSPAQRAAAQASAGNWKPKTAAQSSSSAPAAPFGVEMGSPGSCTALPEKLKSIDPNVRRIPSGEGGPEIPDAYSYMPMDKVFPGANQNLLANCVEDKLTFVVWSVDAGRGSLILLEVLKELDAKYQLSNIGETSKVVFKNGGEVWYLARQASISVSVNKEKKRFSLMYQYYGALTDVEFNELRKLEDASVKRKNAL